MGHQIHPGEYGNHPEIVWTRDMVALRGPPPKTESNLRRCTWVHSPPATGPKRHTTRSCFCSRSIRFVRCRQLGTACPIPSVRPHLTSCRRYLSNSYHARQKPAVAVVARRGRSVAPCPRVGDLQQSHRTRHAAVAEPAVTGVPVRSSRSGRRKACRGTSGIRTDRRHPCRQSSAPVPAGSASAPRRAGPR
jgi:hypothetical protein